MIGKRISQACWSLARVYSSKLQVEPAWRQVRNVSANGPAGGSAGQKQQRSGGPTRREQEVTWQSFVPLALLAGGAGAYWQITKYQNEQENTTAAVVKVDQGVGKLQLGGAWKLMDHNAKYVTHRDFFGSWTLMYFGFTYCPDICPNELIRMREVIEKLDQDPATKDKIKPLFVTIDPQRDGPAQLKAYLSDWHPKMIGLTGLQSEVDAICKVFRVYANKSQMGPDAKDYLIDHSVLFYLINPEGVCVNYFGPTNSPEQMRERIADEMAKWKK